MSTLQLNLLDTDGKQTGATAEIQWLPVDSISPHPNNPRLFLREEVVSGIAESIKANGFDPCYAVLVRPFGDGYQMISGHHRHDACKRANATHIAAWVRDMEDDEAFLELVRGNNQGELKPLEIGLHALQYVEMASGGRGKAGGLSEYAREVNKTKGYLSQIHSAAKVFSQLNTLQDKSPLYDKSQHLAAIHKSPQEDWPWLVELLLAEEWSVKDAEAKVKAIDGLQVDERLHGWLNPEQYKKQAVKEAKNGNKSDIVDRVTRWSKTAVECLGALQDSRPVWLFKDGEPYRDVVSPKALFLERLPGIGHPSDKKILNVQSQVLAYLDELDREYADWEARQRDDESARKAAEEEARRLSERQALYTPDGFNCDLRDAQIEPESIDLVLTDPPYLLSNGGVTLRSGKEASVDKNFADSDGEAISPEEWVPIIAGWLKPGGALIATCTLHILRRLWDAADAAGLETEREQAIWYKRNSPPQLSPDRLQPDFEYIFIAFKPGGSPYFGYEEYRQKYGGQPSRTFDIPQCGGNERLGWHDTQKPLELGEQLITIYSGKDSLILDPFAGSGTFVVAAKRLGRKAVWIEQDSGHYSKAESRIADSPFHWEV